MSSKYEKLIWDLFQYFDFSLLLIFQIGAIYMWSYVYNIVRIYSSCTNSEGEKLDNSTENITPMEETTEKLSNSRMRPLLPLNGCSAVKDHLNHFELDCSITARKPQVGKSSNFDLYVSVNFFLCC